MKALRFRSRIEKNSDHDVVGSAVSRGHSTDNHRSIGGRATGFSSRRSAFARPRVLAASVILLSGASAWWATAQNGKVAPKSTAGAVKTVAKKVAKAAPKKAPKGAPATGGDWKKPVTLDDLNRLVREAARRKSGKGGGLGKMQFALTERDLTPNTPSDEREAEYSANGEFIAFASTGFDTPVTDTNGDGNLDRGDGIIDSISAGGRYHIWIMNRDGSQQRQITGLTTSGPNRDDDRDQRQPSFAPDGNQIVFTAAGLFTTPTLDTRAASQFFIVRPFEDGDLGTPNIQPPVEQRTFFTSGIMSRPSFGANGLSIAFAYTGALVDSQDGNGDGAADDDVNGDGVSDSDTGGEFDIFVISPTGEAGSLRRLTGGFRETGRGTPQDISAQDTSPAFSFVNQNVIFFASTRRNNLGGNDRRIWLINNDGNGLRQVTDPTARRGPQGAAVTGAATDDDDYPAPSRSQGRFTERVGFQTNSRIDGSDNVQDVNVWSVEIDTNLFQPRPTATPFPTPKMIVSSFSNSQIKEYSSETGAFTQNFRGNEINGANQLSAPEGVEFGPDLTNDGFPELYVSNRNANRVDVYDGALGDFIQIFTPDPGGLTNPTSLRFSRDRQFLFVASGFSPVGSDNPSTNRIHRFRADTGAPAPAVGQQGSTFSTGTDGVKNGLEGLVVRDSEIYATALLENKVNLYNADSGVFLGEFAVDPFDTSATTGLKLPTGLNFSPVDGNLYVSSSDTDDILRFDGQSGAFIDVFVEDNNAANFGLDAPEGLEFGPDGNLYVASFDKPSTPLVRTDGDRVLRFSSRTANTPLPSAPVAGEPDLPRRGTRDATFTKAGGNLVGAGSIAFFPRTLRPPPAPTPTPAPPPPPTETTVRAQLESNPTSSPDAFNRSQLARTGGAYNPQRGARDNPAATEPIGQDVAGDREAAFSRSTANASTTAQLVFSSTRRSAAAPGTGGTRADGSLDTRPIVTNPNGEPAMGNTVSHDLWATASEDFTPPILVPVSVGNARFPVLAPGPQSPFNAPRTFEQGLVSGSQARIAVVIEERESGLAPTGSVTMDVFNADTTRFQTSTPLVNEGVPVRISTELKPPAITTGVPLTAFDNGPVSSGGNERQTGAVAGDGIYYCEGTYPVPLSSDFYFDINVTDRAGNGFLYDNIWGFSSRQFVKSSTTSDLFVSDYTQGQRFPASTGDPRFNNMPPIESYFLTNPGRIAVANGGDIQPTTFGVSDGTTTGVPSVNRPVDIWRILCRGEIPQAVINSYAPTSTQQIDPNDPTRQFVQRTRSVAVASSSILWASPYTATVFSGPGTLFDAETQRRLTEYLRAGGRLFVTGRDVAFALSSGGQSSNNFLGDELQTRFGGETGDPNNIIGALSGMFTSTPEFPVANPDFNNLQMPTRNFSLPPETRTNFSFADAATNQITNFFGGGTTGTDIISPGNGGSRVTPAYQIQGNVVGQRIERDNRNNGFQSRVVFFSFGLEGVNRRVSKFPVSGVPFAVNVRPRIAANLLPYFKTGGISGQVVNDETNQPVPNFLLEVSSGGQRFFVRTDARGNYEILGLASGGYGVRPAVDANGRSLNPGFQRSFAGTPRGVSVTGPFTTANQNFRVIPAPLSTLSGTAAQSAGTFDDRSDDTPLPNVRVLVRSVGASSIFPNGGKFARLTVTDAGGRFNISGIPTETELQVIFNPDGRFESQGGDIPDGSGIAQFAQNTNFGRRIIPDSARPDTIILPNENPFVLNDGPGDTPADDPAVDNQGNPLRPGAVFGRGGPILVPVGRTLTGSVFLNGVPITGATVRLVAADSNDPRILPRTVTTLNGAYSFFDVPAGTYTISATFARGTVIIGPESVVVTIPPGRDLTAPNIILRKQDLSGRVTVNGGSPGEALPVELLNTNGSPVIGSDNAAVRTTTDVDGNYVFLNVPPGTYLVRATRQGVARLALDDNGNPIPVTVTLFSVGADNIPGTGDDTGGDAVAPEIKFFERGIGGVVTLNGQGIGGLVVQLLDANQQPVLDGNGKAVTVFSAADGSFTFPPVDRGIYFVQTGIDGINGTDRAVPNPTRVDATVIVSPRITIPLFLHGLRGQVTVAGQTIAGVPVELLQNGILIASTVTAADGSYGFDRIVAAPAPGTTFTVRATRLVAGQVVDRIETEVVIVRGGPILVRVPDLALVSQDIGGRITLNGVPVANAKVELLRGGAGGTVVRSGLSGADGRYLFADLPVGDYIVRASILNDVGFSRVLELRRGIDILDADVALFLRRIIGRVVQNGQPAARATVQLFNSSGRLVQTASAANDGTYTFRNVVGGTPGATYTIRAGRFGDSAQVKVVVTRFKDVQAPTIFLVLSQVGGRVTLNDVPLKGATVILQKGTIRLQRAVTNARGEYGFSTVAAGDYTVIAVSGRESVQVVITVRRGVRVTVPTLKLIRPDVRGTVLVNGRGIAGVPVQLLLNGAVLRSTTTVNGGFYSFENVPIGTYTVRASRGSSTDQEVIRLTRTLRFIVPTLNLQSQQVTGSVTLDGRPRAGVLVQLILEQDVVRQTRTDANGNYNFGEVDPGRYTVRASIEVGGTLVTGGFETVVRAGNNLVIPVIRLRSPAATPTPTPTPDSGPDEFLPGQTYQISVPYSDSTAPNSVTTVAKAFNVPQIDRDGVQNFRLFRQDPIGRRYIELGNSSPIRRGEGYFIIPDARGVSIRRPTDDPTRKPLLASTFSIVLRRNPSQNDSSNGYNLIGFPFDPARFTVSQWLNAEVFVPDGRRYNTVAAAFAAGVVDQKLFTSSPTSTEFTPLTTTVLEPFQGYFARTFIDGVRIVLKASNTPTGGGTPGGVTP